MFFRTAQLVVMILSLLTAGFGVAQARMMTDASGEIVICSEFGIETIRLDANGQPLPPSYGCDCGHCLEGVPVPAGLVPDAPKPLRDGDPARLTIGMHPAALLWGARWVTAQPRGPPASQARGNGS